jgi:N-methylhydantoinase A
MQAASYRLGVDVGGTFTDLLLIDEGTGKTFSAKVPSTPQDQSIGVLNGLTRVCELAGVEPSRIGHVMHGTTVATNTVLTSTGAKVGLITTKGYRHVLQIARSFVPGGLGGWVSFNKTPPLAPLELTIEAHERMNPDGGVHAPLDEAQLSKDLAVLKAGGVEAVTVSLINAYSNGEHERQVRKIVERELPGVPVSISSEVIPEMGEYERAETTVVNSYVRPVVSRYLENLKARVSAAGQDVKLHVLRSDGGLASIDGATHAPVNLLMSGPAGGVAGALWVGKEAGFPNLLTFDMGGTSTDVALIQNGVAESRRETRVADVTVRASSIDVRTVGAGGGSIAYVPELTLALRVGPQSAGAVPGPAAYGRGGKLPTVTDANVVLGYLPANARLGGDMKLDLEASQAALSTIAEPLGKSIQEAAEGVIDIVNENMFGALRLVSIERGYDPRDFALMGFGGAGPLHANALGVLTQAWPVIVPPGPGVLCAYGDATTRLRDEASKSLVRRFDESHDGEIIAVFNALAATAGKTLDAEDIPLGERSVDYEIDLRYRGQSMKLTIRTSAEEFKTIGLQGIADRFDKMHEQLFTFALDAPHEMVTLRAIVQGGATPVTIDPLPTGDGDPSHAVVDETEIFQGGKTHRAKIYDRRRLKAGDAVVGPAIVNQMDTTTLILPGHVGVVDANANILIRPVTVPLEA